MRCAIYARYSTDNQKDTSIEDQIRVCREVLQQRGITPTEEFVYADHAASGATMHLRPDMQKLIRDAVDRKFDLVIAESMSRYSRDQEDIAYIFKRLTFNEIQMSTTTRPLVTEMDIGFEGTISAQYLKDCAAQVKRGMRGQAERGKNPGGLSYGYRIIRQIDERGELVRGELEIHPVEAAIVRRIFEEYAAGKSPRAIVKQLNAENVPAPRGKVWRMSTVHGDGKRGNGILRNQKYIGYSIWNRARAVRNPDTGKRVFRNNPPDEWVVVEKPMWRIVSDELWNRAQARRQQYSLKDDTPVKSRRSSRLLSGLLKCGCCGGSFTIRNSGINGRGERHDAYYGCANYSGSATCQNRRRIKQTEIEERILSAVKENLLSPEAWDRFAAGYARRVVQIRKDRTQALVAANREMCTVESKIKNIIDAVENGFYQPSMKERMDELTQRQAELKASIEAPDVNENVIEFDPGLPRLFRQRIVDLQRYLREGSELTRVAAREKLRGLISEITLTPIEASDNWQIEILGAVFEIIAFAEGREPDYENRLPVGRVALKTSAGDRFGLGGDSETSGLYVTIRLRQ